MDPVYPNLDKKSTLPAVLGTADVLIQVAKKGGSTNQPADYRTWLIAGFPGGVQGFANALPKGIAAGTLPARTLAAGPAPCPSLDVDGVDAGRFLPRRVHVACPWRRPRREQAVAARVA
jgi:hypothetical protein